ncbi:MAG TPA: hypothetical protein VMQ51_02680 [Candidatus Binatia bacterium]|nr:hypothetical protein [Candidatus Binatia bacterium]
MRLQKALSAVAVALWTLLAAGAADAGWMIVDENGQQTALSRGRLKMSTRQAQGVSMSLDIGRARMWVADARRKTYWEGTVEEYCQAMRATVAGAMADMEKQMAEALKDAPPAQREQMQQMMKNLRGGGPGAPPPTVTVEKTTEIEKIAGLPARKFRVLSNGKLYEEVWLTTDPSLLRELEMSKAPDTFGRMSGCMAGMAGGPRPEGSEEFRKLYGEGWPLKVVYYGGEAGRGPAGSTVSKIEQRDIPDGEFAPPAGFRAAPINEVFGSPPRR